MTDLNAGLEFGFLSSLVNISFPPGNSLLFVVGTGPYPPNNQPSVVFSNAIGFPLPGNATEFKLVDVNGHVGPITGTDEVPTYCGSSVSYQGMTFNWMVVSAKTELSVVVSFNPPDQTQYGVIYAVIVSRPQASSFTTSTFQFPVPADPATFYSIYKVSFSGKKGKNSVPAYEFTIPSVQNLPAGANIPQQVGPDLNLALQVEGMMGPFGPSAASFEIAYDPTQPSLTILPDQNWFD